MIFITNRPNLWTHKHIVVEIGEKGIDLVHAKTGEVLVMLPITISMAELKSVIEKFL